ncbi:MAG: transglycosylase SLT domain-containing protein [Candidatus Paceibacterota bacterium]
MEVSAIIFLAGALGALCKDIFKDNTIEMPKWEGGKLGLGFIGGMIIGGAAGMYIDGSFITAFMAGFTGVAILQAVLDGKEVRTCKEETEQKAETEKKTEDEPLAQSQATPATALMVEKIIRYIANQKNVDPDLAVRVAKAESSLSPTALNINADGSKDRGLYQINDKYHPEITDEQAYDIVLSTRFFCDAVLAGNLSWWNASKKNWEKETT